MCSSVLSSDVWASWQVHGCMFFLERGRGRCGGIITQTWTRFWKASSKHLLQTCSHWCHFLCMDTKPYTVFSSHSNFHENVDAFFLIKKKIIITPWASILFLWVLVLLRWLPWAWIPLWYYSFSFAEGFGKAHIIIYFFFF